jgi:DNA-binding beta-propeller fold protein YncE
MALFTSHSPSKSILLVTALLPSIMLAQTGVCSANAKTLTPSSWRAFATAAQPQPSRGLTLVAEIALPGPANRFDYQSIDSTTRRLYINHMNAGRTIVFDLDAGHVVGEIKDVPQSTGVSTVPEHHAVYISAAGAHDLAIVDDRTLAVVSRVGGIRFPDGIAYARDVDKVFVSDESGGTDVVIDAKTRSKRSTIDLGGEAGNTHYDAVSHCIMVAVQTRNQMVAINPAMERIVARYNLPGCDQPHGFTIDEQDRLAFVSCEGNAALLVLDLRTMIIVDRKKVADDPDVLAWDPAWRRLYVAAESGVLSAWWLNGATLRPIGEIRALHAHTVAVDPMTHRVYLPLENLRGKPVLRIYAPLAH